MRILFVGQHTCIRAIKIGVALADAGHEVGWIHHVTRQDLLPEIGPSWFSCNYRHMSELVSRLAPGYDVIHAHTQPTTPVALAKLSAQETPVVYDVHDLERTAWAGKYSDAEIAAFGVCDGAIFVSEATRDLVYSEISRIYEIPTMVLHSKVPRRLLPDADLPSPLLGGIVYQGMVSSALHHRLPDAARAMTEARIPFFVYPNLEGEAKLIRDLCRAGAVLCSQMPYPALLLSMRRHVAAYIGTCEKDQKILRWKNALPNKLFEAMTAGIPVIAHNAPAVAEYVEKHNAGIGIESIEDLPCAFRKLAFDRFRGKKELQPDPENFFMDEEVGRLTDFYRKVIECHSRKRLKSVSANSGKTKRLISATC